MVVICITSLIGEDNQGSGRWEVPHMEAGLTQVYLLLNKMTMRGQWAKVGEGKINASGGKNLVTRSRSML